MSPAAKRRRPSRARTAADDDLRARLADLQRIWAVGDECLAANLHDHTTIAAIDGEVVVLSNGDRLHITKLRSVTK